MNNKYRSGIPTERDYLMALASEEFKEMEISSSQFLLEHNTHLKKYSQKWVKDPLHQWSRQWEYPFVLNRLKPFFSTNASCRILDAGSGITFYPYFLKSKYKMVNVNCCDRDQSLIEIYKSINMNNKHKVEFLCSDLHSTDYEDNSFDCIYCISVLEHANNYPEILEEFLRILKPGGHVIITFDLSLDEKHTITPKNGEFLLKTLSKYFDDEENLSCDLLPQLSIPDIFTTKSADIINANMLPWSRSTFIFSNLRSILLGKGFVKWPPVLTVFCLCLTKKNI